MNLYAPHLIHLEMPFTFADYKQRRDRIHRIDSIAHGIERIWIWRLVTFNTVEEKVDQMVWRRRRQAEAIQGQVEAEGVVESLGNDQLWSLMFE